MNGWGEVAGRGLVVIGIAALATAVMTLVLVGVCVLLEHWWPLGDGIDLDEADRPAPTPQPRWVAYSGETLPQQPAPARVHPEITGGSP